MDQQAPPTHYEQTAPRRCTAHLQQVISDHMSQLHGWCALEKATFLMDLIFKTKPKVVLEIGVWGGKSLIPMAYALRENKEGMIYGIDPWDSNESVQWILDEANKHFWENANHHWVLQHLLGKLQEFNLQGQVTLIQATSEAALPIADIDILHVDGNHSDHASFHDVTKWVPYVKSGGWIIFDDMKWSEAGTGTTERATRWLDEHCMKLAEFTDVCTWGVWVKP